MPCLPLPIPPFLSIIDVIVDRISAWRRFLLHHFALLEHRGVVVFTGEPTLAAGSLETVIMMSLIKGLDFLGLRRMKPYDDQAPVTDIWLYEEESLRQMLLDAGFNDIKIQGYGVFVPLLNWPSTIVFRKIFGKSTQPEWYWRLFGWLDRNLFFWLSANKHSHFVIAARKPDLAANEYIGNL